jgi:hypothetical protein
MPSLMAMTSGSCPALLPGSARANRRSDSSRQVPGSVTLSPREAGNRRFPGVSMIWGACWAHERVTPRLMRPCMAGPVRVPARSLLRLARLELR